MRALEQEEIASVLACAVPATLASLDEDGFAYLTPIWFVYDPDDQVVRMTSFPHRPHVANLRRDPRASLVVELEGPPTSRGRANVQVKGRGRVEVRDDLEGRWTQAITLRYGGTPAYAHERAGTPRVLIELAVERLVGRAAGPPAPPRWWETTTDSGSVNRGAEVEVRPLEPSDRDTLVAAFATPEWNKPPERYDDYVAQHNSGEITCLVAWIDGQLAGYLKIVWDPSYPPLTEADIPEIQDLNVLAAFRRRGVATRLLDEAERLVAQRSSTVGIGVGLHPGYNAAQRLFVLRGYVPDGRGLTSADRYVEEGEQVTVDDELVLHFDKQLGRS